MEDVDMDCGNQFAGFVPAVPSRDIDGGRQSPFTDDEGGDSDYDTCDVTWLPQPWQSNQGPLPLQKPRKMKRQRDVSMNGTDFQEQKRHLTNCRMNFLQQQKLQQQLQMQQQLHMQQQQQKQSATFGCNQNGSVTHKQFPSSPVLSQFGSCQQECGGSRGVNTSAYNASGMSSGSMMRQCYAQFQRM